MHWKNCLSALNCCKGDKRVILVVALLSSATCKQISSTTDTRPPGPLIAVKDCNDYSTSIGKMKYHLWRDGDFVYARCELVNDLANMKYEVEWLSKAEIGKWNEVHHCSIDLGVKPVVCQHRFGVPVPHQVLVCKITANNEFDSERLAFCRSKEIYLVGPETRRFLSPEMNKTEWRRTGGEIFNYNLPGYREARRQMLNIENLYGDYFVTIDKYDHIETCYDWDQTYYIIRDMKVDLSSNPQTITWNCTIVMQRTTHGRLMVDLINGNSTDPLHNMGLYLKRCIRHQSDYKISFRCEHRAPIVDEFLGKNLFYCYFYKNSSWGVHGTMRVWDNLIEYKLKSEREFRQKECTTSAMNYTVWRKSEYEEMNLTTTEDPNATEPMPTTTELFNKDRNRSRDVDRGVLPWETGPDYNLTGYRYNGKQYMMLSYAAFVVLTTISCLCVACPKLMTSKKMKLAARPCWCEPKRKYRKGVKHDEKLSEADIQDDYDLDEDYQSVQKWRSLDYGPDHDEGVPPEGYRPPRQLPKCFTKKNKVHFADTPTTSQ